MNNEKSRRLIKRYLQGTATPEEDALLETWYLEAAEQQQDVPGEPNYAVIEEEILQSLRKTQIKPIRLWPRIAVAASVTIAISFGAYFLLVKDKKPVQVVYNAESVKPVQNGVTLTLSNGQKVDLDQSHRGRRKVADGTSIAQSANVLSYENSEPATGGPLTHTLTNNSATRFGLTLADGTVVYLDVASSITYPTSFTGGDRLVKVTGQAYFKVIHNKAKPFRVEAGNEMVEDIGTEFNVDAYNDAPLKTTLLQGAVMISIDGQSKNNLTLKPGQQAILTGRVLTEANANVEVVTAWLQGKIIFYHETLESVLTRVARIYDVKFVWESNDLRKIKMIGVVSRTRTLAGVLNFFKKTGEVDFIMEGKTIRVIKRNKYNPITN